MRINSINKSMVRNFGSAIMNKALLASPFSTGAYCASRRVNYGCDNSSFLDKGLNKLKSESWKTKLKHNKDNTIKDRSWVVTSIIFFTFFSFHLSSAQTEEFDGNAGTLASFAALPQSGADGTSPFTFSHSGTGSGSIANFGGEITMSTSGINISNYQASVKRTDNASFGLEGMVIENSFGYAGATVLIQGRSGGADVSGASTSMAMPANFSAITIDVSSDSDFDNIDEFTITFTGTPGTSWGFRSITVTAGNSDPTFTSLASTVETTNEDTPVEITFTEIANQGDESDDGTVDAFVVQAVSTGTLTINGSPFAASTNDEITATKSATWTPAADASGTLNAFTITAKDDQGAESTTGAVQATVSVTELNDPPTLSGTSIDPTWIEDGGAVDLWSSVTASTIESGQTISGFTVAFAGRDGSDEVLTIDGTAIQVVLGGSGTTATNSLSYSIVASEGLEITFSGATLSSADFQTLIDGISYNNTAANPSDRSRAVAVVDIIDSGSNTGSNNNTTSNPTLSGTRISTTLVNDTPSFTIGSNQTVSQSAGAQTIAGHTSGMTDNDGNTQTLTFNVSNDNNGIFDVQPDIDETTGSLTFTPKSSTFGKATVTVSLSDDGGTANGASDQSADQTFDIFITPNNIKINEVDADDDGSDDAEFVEIFNNSGATINMNGLVLVYFNGGDQLSSGSSNDLDGNSLANNDFFVVGMTGVTNLDLDKGASAFLQNDAEAVALYVGDGTDFADNTSITTDGLVDVLVYGPNNGERSSLATAFGGVTPADDDATTTSFSRSPDGTGSFVAQAPTPGVTNDVTPPTITAVGMTNASAKVGDAITISITAGEAGLSLNTGTVNGVNVTGFTDNGGGSYSATYTVAEGNTDRPAGDDVPVNFVLTDAAGNNSTAFTTAISQGSDAIDANSPSVTAVGMTNASAKIGDAITISITAGESGLSLNTGTVNGVSVTGFTDNGGGSYSATYTVAEGNTDRAAGDDVPVNFVLADAAGNTSTAFTTGISQGSDAIDANSPSVTAVGMTNASAKIGDAITVAITATEAGLSLNTGTVNGVTVTGFTDNGSGNYSATYTVASGNTDRAAGDDVPVNFILADAAGNTSTAFTTGISQGSDPIDANAPTVTAVGMTNAAAKIGDAVTISITASEAGLSLNTGTVNGVSVTGFTDNGGGNYSATYTVASGNTDRAAGDDVPVNFILADAAGNTSTAFTTGISQGSDPIDANSPSVTAVSIPNSAAKVGDAITVSITASEAGLSLNTGTVNGVNVTGFTDNGGGSYSATYTVAEGNTDRAIGDIIPVSFILDDAAGNSSATFNTAISQNADAIDANSPTVTAVGMTNAAAKIGDAITVAITATEAGLSLNTGTVNGVTVTGFTDNGSGNYSATYTVASGNTDRAAGDDVPVNFILADAAGNTSTAFTTPISQGSDAIDANAPTVTAVGMTNATAKIGDAVTISITASEAGLSLNTGTVNGEAVTGFTDNGGGSYSATYTVVEGNTDRAAGVDVPVSFILDDAAGNSSATFGTAISQGSDAIDANSPTFSSSSPVDEATDVSIVDDVTITFNEDITFGTGSITLSDVSGGGTSSIVIDAANPGSQASISGVVLTINPTADLILNNIYAVQIDATAIDDLAGNSYLGITNNSTLNFTTVATTVAFTSTSSNAAESTSSADLAVSLNAASTSTVTVDYAVTGTATGSGTDYTLANGTLTFNPTETTKNITIASIVDDALDEVDETVIVTLSNPLNAGLGANTVHTYTINDNDPSPTIAFDATSSSGAEATTSANLAVSLSAVSGQDVTVDYTVTGTATGSGTDYTLADGTLTINAGGSTDNITIASIVGDALDENDETVIVTLSNPSNATLGTNTVHTYTIFDDDATPTIEFNTSSSSGAESTSSTNLQADLSAISGRDVTVNYTVTGTATGSGTDYTLADGTLTLTAGTSLDNITIAGIIADVLDEDDETVIVTLSSPTNATLGTNTTHTYTILDDDATPTISFTAASANGAETVSSANLQVDLSAVSGRTVTADYALTGTATGGGTDFTLADGTLTFSPGDNSETITIAGIVDDAILESNETVIVTLSNLVNANAGTTQQFTYTIFDNDAAAVTIADVSQDENNGAMTFTATLDNAVEGGFTVEVNSTDGTAETGDSDYLPVTSETLTFTGSAGETQTFTVTPTADTKLEADETFTVSMTNLGATSLSVDITDTATGTIENDDTATVTIEDVSGAENGGDLTFTATLDNAVQGGFSFEVNSSDGTATTADSDYNPVTSETLTFAGSAGETQQFTVTPIADTRVESNETLSLSMTSLQGTSFTVDISDGATGTITNDDAATIAISDVSRAENADGGFSTTYTFTATLTGDVDQSFSVDYATADGTAAAGSDYTASSGTLTFDGNNGETETFSVIVTNDDVVELDETFTAVLSNLQAGGKSVTISDASGTGTITNDDAATISIDDVTKAENGDGGASTNFVFTVTLDKAVDTGFTVDFGTGGNTATTADNDYVSTTGQLTFVGTAGETQTITVTVNDDDKVEQDETFGVQLSNLQAGGNSVTIADADGVGTITNDDAATITIADVSGNEDDGTITLTATLDKAVDTGFQITVQSTDGSATTGSSDYAALNQNLTFAGTAGETQQFTITPTADQVLESDETLTVSITGTTSTLTLDISDNAIVTIQNDDSATLSIVDVTKDEGNSGTTAYVFDVVLTGAVDQQVTVDYATADGTATTADSDYTATSGTLTFAGTDGEVEQITVNVTGDTNEESDENFLVTLSNIGDNNKGVAFAGSDNQATGTITNEDDNTAPTGFTVTLSDTEINAAEASAIGFTFAGAEVGTTYNYSITSSGGGTAVTGTGTIATATDAISGIDVSGLSDGTLTLSVTLTDSFSNESTAQTDTAVLDQTAPTGTTVETISTDTGDASDDAITNDNTLSFSGTAEAGSTVEVFIDLVSIGTTTATNAGEWTFDHTGTTLRDAVFRITAKATDAFGNVGAQGAALRVEVDTRIPQASLTTAAPSLINASIIATITFDEVLSNFDISDVTVTNGTASEFTAVIAGQAWSVRATPTTDGTMTVQVPAGAANDVAGNGNTASNTLTFTFDGTDPTVSAITRADASPTQAQQVDFDVVFSEDVNNVDATDFEIPVTGTITGATVSSVTQVTAATYTVTVDRGTGEGTFGLNVKDDDTIVDDANNALGGVGLGNADFTGEIYNTNNSPTDITLSASAIDENNALSAVVATLTTTDADAGDTFTYSLASGTGDDDNASFLAAGDELIALVSFDFETKASYSVRLQTEDNKSGTFEKQFTITINNVNETPTDMQLSNATIQESDDPVSVGFMTSTDEDNNETFSYSLVEGVGDDNNLLFNFVGNELRTTGSTNFEEDTELNIRVRVTDSGGNTFDKTFVIDVTNLENEPLRDFDKDESDARVKNFFTPNGDGQNDTWVVEDILDNPINEVKVYSQAGKLIFSQRNYENDWDGTFDGEPIPPGTYYYEINIYNGESIIRGFLTIIRN